MIQRLLLVFLLLLAVEPIPRALIDQALVEAGYTQIQLDGPTHAGLEVQVDLPLGQRIKNIGSHRDGAGMCVFSSCEMSLRWQNEEAWRGWRDWCAERYPGGGYDTKVDKLIAAYAKAKQIPVPGYLQYSGTDTSVLTAALASGRLPAVTYAGRDGVHYRSSIAHMVNLVYFDGKKACILDNNFIGENDLVWMDASEFVSRWTSGGSGWCVVFFAPPPPLPPRN